MAGDGQAEEAEVAGLVALRITLLGPSQAGKTSLISSFVNNFCPSVYVETDDPALYYKCLELPDKLRGGVPFRAMAEIEDTYAWERRDGTDCFGRPRDARVFATPAGGASRGVLRSQDQEDGVLLGSCVAPELHKYTPVAPRRMAYVVVFDASDASSLTAARGIAAALDRSPVAGQAGGPAAEPVVCLAAAKLDRALDKDALRLCRQQAQRLAADSGVLYAETTTTELQSVRRLFRQVLGEVLARPALWRAARAPDTGWRSRLSASAASMGALVSQRSRSKDLPERDAGAGGAEAPAERAGAPAKEDCALQ